MSRVYSAEEKREMLKALSIQNAVNLTAVLRSWSEATSVVREAVGTNHGGDFNSHPINVLYASKVASMLGFRTDPIGGVEGQLPGFAFGGGKDSPINRDLAYWAFGEANRVKEESET